MAGNLVEALIGAAVLAVAGLFLVYAYNRTDIRSVQGYELSARFERANGLTLGTDVRISGIKVGTVISQNLDPQTFEAVVRLTVKQDLELPIDTQAVVASEGLLGGSYLSLVPGGDEELLGDGDEIEWTQGSLDLMGLIGQAIFAVTDSGTSEAPAN